MSDEEKRANEAIAEWLHRDWLKGKKGNTLDIGGAYPWLAHSLGRLGHDATAIDGEPHAFDGMTCKLITGDFEDALSERVGYDRYRLVSAVHTLEHFSAPVNALRLMHRAIAADGFVFIRSPDHSVAGFERDLTTGHYQIHPFYHCLDSLLQCLVELEDAFEVAWTQPFAPGQRDLILRPIKKRPALGLAMIVKNEARDLPRCLDSIAPIIDAAAIMDTGSTDDTMAIARAKLANVPSVAIESYFGASIADADGNWQLWDFGKARNHALEAVASYRPDWVTWMDGDDELLTPDAYKRAMYRGDMDSFAVTIESGGSSWAHQRLWRASKRVRFAGKVHEYPVIDGLRNEMLAATIRHNLDPDASQENANARNLRILMREWQESPNERTAFYIANTHRDGGRWNEAVKWYGERLQFGPAKFRDEYLFAWLYLARALIGRGDKVAADLELSMALDEAPDWREFTMQRARLLYDQQEHKAAIEMALQCVDAPIPQTPLWREPEAYSDGPCRLISWCYEHLGKTGKALIWAIHAADRIGKPDAEWDARIARLKAATLAKPAPVKAPAIVTRRRERIALVRPGAIGDVLMTLNLLPAFSEENPDADIHYFTDIDGLDDIIKQAGATRERGSATTIFMDRTINLVGYPLAEGYPDKPMRRHLLDYFAEEMVLPWLQKHLPALELPLPPRPAYVVGMVGNRDYATLQIDAGWSAYKQWIAGRWHLVADALPFPLLLIDKERTPQLSDAIAAIANARIHLGVDSFGNHLTNYFWKYGNSARRVPGVILWGSTQMEAAGYPTNINIGHRLPCGPCFKENPAISKMPRGLCVDPPGQTRHDQGIHACMAAITVDEVVAAALMLWERSGEPARTDVLSAVG